MVGYPALALALTYHFARHQMTVALRSDSGSKAAASHSTGRVVVLASFEPRTAVLVCLGSPLQLFVLSTICTSMPSFLNRCYGLLTDQARLMAVMVILVGALGTVAWDHLADRAGHRQSRRKLYVITGACMLAVRCHAHARGRADAWNDKRVSPS